MSDDLEERQIELEQQTARVHQGAYIREQYASAAEGIAGEYSEFYLDTAVAIYSGGKHHAPVSVLVGKLHGKHKCVDFITSHLEVLVEMDALNVDDKGEVFLMHCLDAESENVLRDFMSPLPSIAPPKRITEGKGHRQTIYRTLRETMVTNTMGLLPKDACLSADVANSLSRIAYRVNLDVLGKWRDRFEEPERKEEDTEQTYAFKMKLYLNFHTCGNRIRKLVASLAKKHYFWWFYDTRGRMYPKAYHVTPHGDPRTRAFTEFADGETIDITDETHETSDWS